MSAKTRVISNFKIYGANLAVGAGGVTTGNVAESGNLYYTDSRARQSISVTGSGSYDNTTGVITITGGGGGGNVDSVAGATGVISNVQLAAGVQSTGIFNTSNVVEGSNLYFTNARVYSNVTQLGYITSGALSGYATNSQLSVYATNSQLDLYVLDTDLTTANVSELDNLYFTNARVYSNVINLGYITSSSLNGYATNNQLTLYATTANLDLKANISDLTTANVTEVNNLYYSNARVYNNVTQLGYITNTSLNGYATNSQLSSYALSTDLTTANVTEVNNLYYSNARVYDNVTQLGYITNTALNGYATNNQLSIYALDTDLTTANVSELNNLYFTNARVYSNVTEIGYITSSALSGYATNNQLSVYATNTQLTSYVLTDSLTTANVTELTNLYFTNARAYANVSPLIPKFTYGTSPPGTPQVNDEWVDSNTGIRYIYIDDGTSSQWVEFGFGAYTTGVTSFGGLTGDVSNTQVLYSILTVDGSGSGLDADLLDGLDSTYYSNATNISAGTLASARLPTSGVSAATYGNATFVPQLIIDTFGRVTSASNVTVNVANSNIVGNIISSKLEPTGVTASTYGDSAVQTIITIDQQGRITNASNVTSTVANTNISGNIISSKLEPTGVTASTYGNATIIPVITVDQQGRITSASNVATTGGVTTGKAIAMAIVFGG